MKVTLISHTPDAVDLLLYTKATRLTLGEDTREKILAMTPGEKDAELRNMARTIPSSWEFIHYVFEILDVTRAFTHQFVRTRQGSYAQQTLRMLDVTDFSYETPGTVSENLHAREIYDNRMASINDSYRRLIAGGIPAEDARGLLPQNIHTNIIAQFNLRTLSELARKRTGGRVQGEYRSVLKAMFDEVITTHPWAAYFLFPRGRGSFTKVEEFIAKHKANDLELATEALKDVDLARQEIG